MNIHLSNSQIKQFSLAVSINDVLNCITNNYDNYLQFLKEELYNQQITKEEYDKELLLINRLRKVKELKV
jgi:hypothetical protein